METSPTDPEIQSGWPMGPFNLLRTTCCCAALLFWCLCPAQSFDEYKKKTQGQFQAYKQQQEASLNAYRDKINKEFSELLGRPWKQESASPAQDNPLKLTPPAPVPSRPAPSFQPRDIHYGVFSVNPAVPTDPKETLPAVIQEENAEAVRVSFPFLGEECFIHVGKGMDIRPASLCEKDIAKAWEQMSSPSHYSLAADFQSIRERLSLCDWLTVLLAEDVANQVCHSRESAASILLQLWLLNQSGLKAIPAVDKDHHLRKLISTDKQLFDYPAFHCHDGIYYVTDGKPISLAGLPSCRFPSTRPLHMAFTVPGKYPEQLARGERSFVDERRILVYSGYPDYCDEGNSLSCFYYYAQVPLSESAKKQLYPVLRERIKGLANPEAAGVLLSYIQRDYPYREDEKVWRRERYFYAEETLYYPFSDCEDRAILYTWLIRDLLQLPTALVYYPGHLAAAVCFGESVPGDATLIEGKRYLICDPTYIGAGIGREMPTVDTTRARVIPL